MERGAAHTRCGVGVQLCPPPASLRKLRPSQGTCAYRTLGSTGLSLPQLHSFSSNQSEMSTQGPAGGGRGEMS